MFLQKLSRFFIIFFSLQRFMTVFLRKIFCSPVMFTIKKLFLLLCLISSFNLIMIFQNFSTLSADGIKLLFFVKVFSDSYYPCGFFFSKQAGLATLRSLCCVFLMGCRAACVVQIWALHGVLEMIPKGLFIKHWNTENSFISSTI